MPPPKKRGRPPKAKSTKCLSCAVDMKEPYQLIFDENGIELELQKLLSTCFGMRVVKDTKQIQALCEDCLNRLIDIFDVMQKKTQEEPGPSTKSGELPEIRDEVENFDLENEEIYEVIEESEIINVKDSDLTEFEEETQVTANNPGEDHSENDPRGFESIDYLEDFDEEIDIREYKIGILQNTLSCLLLPESIQCRLCSESFEKHADVLSHTECAHCIEDFAYPCVIDENCEPQKSTIDLSLHLVFKHYDLEKLPIYTQCPECDKRFNNFLLYNKHSCYVGGKISRSATDCVNCGKTFKSNKRYRFHQNFHQEKRRPKACFICDKSFRDEDEFYEHIMYEHQKNLGFICLSCDMSFTNEKNLKNHESIHKIERQYNCKLCSKSYLYNQLLKDHMISAHGTNPFKCHICDKYLIKKTLLNKHILSHSVPQATEVMTCSCCGLIFEKSEESEDHMNKHNESDEASVITEEIDIAYCCEYCELAFNSIDNMIAHRELHDKKKYFCDLCPLSYCEYKKLKTHKLTHFNYMDKRYTFPVIRHYVCDFPDCTMSYLQWTSLRSHKRHKHCYQKSVQCPKCPEEFTDMQQYKKHMEDVHQSTAFKCQFCNKDYGNNMALAVHISRRHNASRFQCDLCEQSYSTKAVLDKHKTNIHSSFPCKICGKVLKNLKNYQVHNRMVHEKEKRYFCKYCNKGYFNNCDKTEHESSVHEKIKKYVCDLCPYSAVYKECLIVHKRAHRNETPYKCELCNKGFRRNYALRVHMKRHYNTKDFVCPYEDCGASYANQGILNYHIKTKHGEGANKEPKKKRKQLAGDGFHRPRYEESAEFFVDDDDGLDDGVIGEPSNQAFKGGDEIMPDDNIEYIEKDIESGSGVPVHKIESDHNYIVEEVFEVVMQDI